MARLRLIAKEIQPQPASRHCKRSVFIFKDLTTTTHVYLREDALKGALQPAYTGPHEIIERGDKVFKILIKGKPVSVTIERLKPAYILSPTNESIPTDDTSPPPVNDKDDIPVTKTRSGRTVRLPVHYHP